jgi:imidazoleglycerol-phosphate dehydratase
MPMKRQQQVSRKTQETEVQLELNLDGRGEFSIMTSIPFLDHMLALFAKHALFDLKIKATGDTEVDYHHTMEDVGMCLGKAFKEALGEKKGIRRFGQASVPMIDSLATVVLDLSGRPHLVLRVEFPSKRVGELDVELFEEFLRAFSSAAEMDLHIHVPYGSNVHHTIEAIFKALARACEQAVHIDSRMEGVWSTKGTL